MGSIRTVFSKPNWASVIPAVKETTFRFPLPVVFILCATLLSLLLIHDLDFGAEAALKNTLITLLFSAVALTSFKLFIERRDWPAPRQLIGAVGIVAFTAYFVWIEFADTSEATYVLFSLSLVLSLQFAPYLRQPGNPSSVWYFNYQTGVAVFFAATAALILGIGCALILVSVGYLFEIKIPSEAYADAWLLCWGLLFPIYVLANICRDFEFDEENCEFPKGIGFITNYILVPMMFVYMAILYAYFVRIVIQWELPRGNLGWMIIAFGSIGIATKLLAYPIRDKGTRLLALFDRYYYRALIVPILLLALAIGVRINEYGVTEQRYAVVLLGIWFLTVALLANLWREQLHPKHIPMILAVMALLGSFGPWGAVEVSDRSQTNRFESLLTRHKLLINGQAVKAPINLPFETRKSLSSIADYLNKNERRFERIRPWFESLMAQENSGKLVSKRRNSGKELVELLGVDYVNRWQKKDGANTLNYNNSINLNNLMLDVSGFSYIGRGNFHTSGNAPRKQTLQVVNKNQLQKIAIDYEGDIFKVKIESGESVEFDLVEFILSLKNKQSAAARPNGKTKFVLTQASGNGRLKIRLIVEQIRGETSENNETNITNLRYILLLGLSDPDKDN